MNKQYIKVVHDGLTSKVEAIGFTGASCEAATKAIEEVLGQVQKREEKPEYYRDNEQQTNQVGTA